MVSGFQRVRSTTEYSDLLQDLLMTKSSVDICSRRRTRCTVRTAPDDTTPTTAASLVLEEVGLELALE